MLSILKLLAVSSIWISLVAGCCPLLVGVVYGILLPAYAPVVAFLCAFFVYSWDKVSGSTEDLLNTPGRAVLAAYPIKELAMLAYLAAFVVILAADWTKWYCVAVFGAAGGLYTKSIFGVRLKDLPGLKAPYVAATCTICFAGLVGAGYGLIFLLILINTIIFDIRDVIGDAAAGVRTVPVLIGVSRTVWILAILDLPLIYLDPIAGLIGAGLIFYFRHQRPSLLYDYLVDGWVIISLVLNYLTDLERLI